MYMTLKNLFNLSNNTYGFKVFDNEIWGKISYYPVLPSTAISWSIAQPGKTRVFPPGFSRAVNTLPTLLLTFLKTSKLWYSHYNGLDKGDCNKNS